MDASLVSALEKALVMLGQKDAATIPEVTFMPWAGLASDVRIGPVTFSPWTAVRTKISNKADRDYLDLILGRYVDYLGKPVQTITMGRLGSRHIRTLSGSDLQIIRAAATGLEFACVYPITCHAVIADNPTLAPPTAEKFRLIYQKVVAGTDLIIFGYGKSIKAWTREYDVNEHQPLSMFDVQQYTARGDILLALGQALYKKKVDDDHRRLLSSLEWFSLANTNASEVHWRMKVMMMVTAFETLLNIQKQQKAGEFADYLDTLSPKAAITTTRKDSNSKSITRTQKGFWGWEFYRLRNDIAHGKETLGRRLPYDLANSADWRNHLIVANLVFGEAVCDRLNKLGYLAKPDNIDDVYRMLKWVK